MIVFFKVDKIAKSL